MIYYLDNNEKSVLVTAISMVRVNPVYKDSNAFFRMQAVIFDIMRSIQTNVKKIDISEDDIPIIMQCLIDYAKCVYKECYYEKNFNDNLYFIETIIYLLELFDKV